MTGFNKTRTTAVRLSKAVGDPGAGNENGGEQWRRQLWGTGARAPVDFQI